MKVSLPQRNKLAQSMLWNLFLLTVGAVFFSLGAQAVAAHHGFLTGGIFGAGLLGWYTTGLFTPAIWYLLINIPLFFVSWFQIGRQFFFYSLYGSLATTIISELITFQVPIQDHFYAAITAGVLCGTGTGLMLRTLGSGGGLDLIGVILNKRWNIGIGRFNFCFNAVMFLASMATISLDMVIVSFIQVFVASATIEYALRMGSQRKMVYVVTDRGEALCEAIIAEGYGGATVLKGKGAYSGGDREIILTVTNNIMLRRLENLVFAIDDTRKAAAVISLRTGTDIQYLVQRNVFSLFGLDYRRQIRQKTAFLGNAHIFYQAHSCNYRGTAGSVCRQNQTFHPGNVGSETSCHQGVFELGHQLYQAFADFTFRRFRVVMRHMN